MKVYFCDHCNESVPLVDLERGIATVSGDRVLCERCRPPSVGSGAGRRTVLLGAVSGGLFGALVAAGVAVVLLRGDRGRPHDGEVQAIPILERRVGDLGHDVEALRARLGELLGKPGREGEGSVEQIIQPPEGEDLGESDSAEGIHQDEPAGPVLARDRVGELDSRLRALEARLDGGGVQRREADREEGSIAAAGNEGVSLQDLGQRMGVLELRHLAIEKSLTELEAAARRGGVAGGGRGSEGSPAAEGSPATRGPIEEDARDAARWEDLLGKLAEDDPGLRWEAVEGLAGTGDPKAVSYLLQALGDPDPFVRFQAAKGLATFGDRRAIEPLLAALGDEEEMVRESAHESLRVLTLQSFPFDAQAPPEARGRAIARWKAWWRSSRKEKSGDDKEGLGGS